MTCIWMVAFWSQDVSCINNLEFLICYKWISEAPEQDSFLPTGAIIKPKPSFCMMIPVNVIYNLICYAGRVSKKV